MFFSVSNDGETYRYSTFKFTFVGNCVLDSFHKRLYLATYLFLGLLVFGLLTYLLCGTPSRRRASRACCTTVTRVRSASGSRGSAAHRHGRDAGRPQRPQQSRAELGCCCDVRRA